MTKHFSLIAIASATLLFAAASVPAQALDLSDTLGGLNNTLGGATDTANSLTGDNSQTTADVGSNGELNLTSRSALADGIEAQARALSPRQLARLCVSAGGGAGCGSGDRSQVLGIIDNRLGVLSDNQLASLCVGSGADGCGSGARSGNAAVPANASNRSRRLASIAASLSTREVIAYKKRCRSVLRNPQAYENDIVQICSLIN